MLDNEEKFLYRSFIQELKQSGFTGDIHDEYSHRVVMSTDNSIYQFIPEAVLYPKVKEDLVEMMRLANQSIYSKIHFTAKGGGTSTNGQSLNFGIIVDTSKYFRQIKRVDVENQTVEVECGVIRDQLNDVLLLKGLFFSPDLSTSNRATLGGMISTDASGAGSVVYGKTSDHVLELTVLLNDGNIYTLKPWNKSDREQLNPWLKNITDTIITICKEEKETIDMIYPKLNRFLTGYDLQHVYDEEKDEVNLCRLFCGSEGTLGFILSAKLSCDRLPKDRKVIVIQYDSFDAALRHAPELLKIQAVSIETIDSTVLNLAKKDVIWQEVETILAIDNNLHFEGINIVEFHGDVDKVKQLIDNALSALGHTKNQHIMQFSLVKTYQDIQALYRMRKKAVGILGNSHGDKIPCAFVEDVAVPPIYLADFILEFRKILDEYGLSYGMFGHVDAGVLHVRPQFDLSVASEKEMLLQVSDRIFALTMQYQGVFWGEHGRGVRSQYGEKVFGALYHCLRKIKGMFDPNNRFNKGKICTPLNSQSKVYKIDSDMRGQFNALLPIAIKTEYDRALKCNGNGLCHSYQQQSVMCPSYKIRWDKTQSPKGRADLLRAWLLLPSPTKKIFDVFFMKKSVQKSTFSASVYESMLGCLACKACSTSCPVQVDIPTLKSQFLYDFHQQYRRPLYDYILLYFEQIVTYLARFPNIMNVMMRTKINQWVLKKIGLVDLPLLVTPSLMDILGIDIFDMEKMEQSVSEKKDNTILIVQDAFTSFYDNQVVVSTVRVLRSLQYRVYILPFTVNGKTMHVKGFMRHFKKNAEKVSFLLEKYDKMGVTLMGIDVAMTLVYRDEYYRVLNKNKKNFFVYTIQEILYLHIQRLPELEDNGKCFRLFLHCTEQSLLLKAFEYWQVIFSRLGIQLLWEKVGCCGMAGVYGHEVCHVEDSKMLYRKQWQSKVDNMILVSGFSCRSQVKRVDGIDVLHPIQMIEKVLCSLDTFESNKKK